jgi:predicted dehydrogenase
MDGVEVSCLIDPDKNLFDSRSKMVHDKGGNTPECVQDIRVALENKNLDAISVATCNHWHSLITVWACQAGKDVYVEKPISHNVWEGRQCVAAAAKYNRIVQHGTQNRSSQGKANEIAAVQSGKYGKLLVSKGYCCKPRWSIGHKAVTAPPANLDWDLWLGPAPKQDFHGNLHTYNWHWFWDTGNGDTGNQGVHEMDIARWAIKGATMPNRVWSIGGRYVPGEKDQGQTPNMQISVYEYDEATLLFETRGLVGKSGSPDRNVSNEYYTTEGMIKGGTFYPKNGGASIQAKGEAAPVTPGGAFGSFIHAVRSRDNADVNCDAEVAHYSAALCHLGNISYRLGKQDAFSGNNNPFGKNEQIKGSLDMLQNNLKAVKIDLNETTVAVGRDLKFDPATESFPGDKQADALLTRPYRKPYIVPEIS